MAEKYGKYTNSENALRGVQLVKKWLDKHGWQTEDVSKVKNEQKSWDLEAKKEKELKKIAVKTSRDLDFDFDDLNGQQTEKKENNESADEVWVVCAIESDNPKIWKLDK